MTKKPKQKKPTREETIRAFVECCLILCNGMRVEELSAATGISIRHLYRLEAGEFSENIRGGTLLALADAAGIVAFETPKGYRLKLKKGA